MREWLYILHVARGINEGVAIYIYILHNYM